MGTEAGLWKFLRDRLDPTIDVVRIENLVGTGTPDLNFAAYEQEGWIELKHRHTYPRSGRRVFGPRRGLSVDQIAWIKKRIAAEGHVLIVAGVGKWVFFIRGHHAKRFNDWTLDQLINFAWITLHRKTVNENTLSKILSSNPRDEPQLFFATSASAAAALREHVGRPAAKRRRVSRAPGVIRPPTS